MRAPTQREKEVLAGLGEDFLEKRIRRERLADALFKNISRLSAVFVLALFLALFVILVQGSWPTIQAFGFRFLHTAEWDPVGEQFGALVPIYGTLMSSVVALLIAVPVSFGIGLFLTELSPTFLKAPLGVAIELLAAIPSIIYGMWGLFVFSPYFAKTLEPWLIERLGPLPLLGPLFQGAPIGISVLAAGIVLAVMVIPYMSAVIRDVFEIVPSMLKESAYGLGATTWEVVWKVVLPQSKAGVIGGVMLGLGRALGETMAVTFVIGNAHQLTPSLLAPGSTISSILANEFTEATGALHSSALIELGLILCFITFLVLALTRVLLRQVQKKEGLT